MLVYQRVYIYMINIMDLPMFGLAWLCQNMSKSYNIAALHSVVANDQKETLAQYDGF